MSSTGLDRASGQSGFFSRPAPVVGCVPVAIAIVVTLVLTNFGKLRVTGDEPHYLVMADGLVQDGTFDLRNAYRREAQTENIYGSPLPAPHVVIVNHRWGPYHEPGLAILLAIPFLVGHTLGSRLALCLIAALLPLWCFKWLRARQPSATAAWLAAGLAVGVPISFGASQIYPDLLAGVVATALMLWLLNDGREAAPFRQWAAFWLVTGLLPWLTLKFLATTLALTVAAIGMVWGRDRRTELRTALATCLLVAIGPATLAAFHMWAFATPLGPRGVEELTSSFGRGAMMFLGLHLDQGQGMFWQQPLLLAGVAALVPFARRRSRIALLWLVVYASLIVPNSLELARYGGGSPAGRFGWSAAWLWIVPLGYALQDGPARWHRLVKPVVIACLAYQALLAVRWIGDPGVLFPLLDENLAVRNSLFPVALRAWLPSFYFWDFSSYWTYAPNLASYTAIGLLGLGGWLSSAHDEHSERGPVL